MNNVSTDGNCGSNSDTNATCLYSTFGDCCSSKGYCGGTTAYCGEGCQLGFGECNDASVQTISTTGSCGATLTSNTTCLGSTYGDCCSGKGYCGGTTAYCGGGCQVEFGGCGSSYLNETEGSTSLSSETLTSTFTSSSSSTSTSTFTSTFTSTLTPTPVSGSDGGGGGVDLSKGAIAGISVGATVAGLGIIALLLWFFLRKRKTSPQEDTQFIMDPIKEPVIMGHEMEAKEMHEMEAKGPRQTPVELPGH
ncbi:hypothetical protein BDV19DRAFT_43740 [Aspergillus venezuelensis]